MESNLVIWSFQNVAYILNASKKEWEFIDPEIYFLVIFGKRLKNVILTEVNIWGRLKFMLLIILMFCL